MRCHQSFYIIVLLLLSWPRGGYAQAPSEQIVHPDDASKQVEYFVRSSAGQGPWPTIVFLHGHQ